MKKIFLALAAFAAMTAVSCVKDEQNPDALVPAPEPEVVYDYSGLVLNELSGAGEDDAKFWELYNNGTQDVDLEGVYINKDESLSWTGKKGQVIKAGDVFAIVGAKNTTDNGFSSGFSAKKSVIVELYAPDGTKLDTFQRGQKDPDWGAGLDEWEGSWSRLPDGTGAFMMTPTATPGAANNAEGAVADPDLVGNSEVVKPEPEPAGPAVVFNEFYGAGEDNEKYIELYNLTDAEVSLEGYTIYKDEDYTEAAWEGPADLKIPANGVYLILGAKGTTGTGFKTGFSSKKSVIMELFDPEGERIDAFQRGQKDPDWGVGLDPWAGSWSRIPDGTGDFMMTETMTAGQLNATEGVEDPDLVK